MEAFEEFLAAIVTQTGKNQLQQKMKNQKHKSMAFLEGKFVGTQKKLYNIRKQGLCDRANLRTNRLVIVGYTASARVYRSQKCSLRFHPINSPVALT